MKEVKVHWKHVEGHAWCGAPIERCGARGEKGRPGRAGAGKSLSTDVRKNVTCQACIGNEKRAKSDKWGSK